MPTGKISYCFISNVEITGMVFAMQWPKTFYLMVNNSEKLVRDCAENFVQNRSFDDDIVVIALHKWRHPKNNFLYISFIFV